MNSLAALIKRKDTVGEEEISSSVSSDTGRIASNFWVYCFKTQPIYINQQEKLKLKQGKAIKSVEL